MSKYVVGRIVSILPTLLGISLLVFVLVELIPGSVVEAILGQESQASPETRQRLREYFGLDRSLPEQYAGWLSRVVQGDLGVSWRTGRAVAETVATKLPITLELATLAGLVAVGVGVPLGLIAGLRQDSAADSAVRLVSLVGLAAPVFWVGTVILLLTSTHLRWAPPIDYVSPFQNLGTNLTMMFLPALTLGFASAANVTRITRSSVLDVLRRDYVRTARAKGLRERAVVIRHVVKNSLVPVLTVVGLQVAYLLGGTVVVEDVFAIPGMGRLVIDAINGRDYPMLQGAVLVIALLFMLTNLIVDLTYALVDPRIRNE